MTYDEGFKFVKSKRACVKPNPGFVKCLREWEEKCRVPPSSQLDDGETADQIVKGGEENMKNKDNAGNNAPAHPNS
jgi:hypothetical protein